MVSDRIFPSNTPYKLDVVFMSLVFYAIGFFTKKYVLYLDNLSILKRLFLFVLCSSLTVVLSMRNGFVGFVNGNFGNDIFVFIFVALSGSLAILLLSSMLSKTKVSKLFKCFGENSLIIMATHTFLIYLCCKVLSYITNSDIVLQQNTNWRQVVASFVVVSFLSLLTALFVDFAKKGIVNNE